MVNVKTRFCPIDTEQEKSGIAALLVLEPLPKPLLKKQKQYY